MIYDRLERAALYHPLNPGLAEALRYVAAITSDLGDGVYELDGEQLVARVQTYETRPEAEQRWESHRAYVDVQVVLSGEEHLVYAPTDVLRATSAYDADRDLIRYEDDAPGTVVLPLRAGDFVVLFPDDGHKPGVAITRPVTVHKVVMKVAVW